MPNPATSKGTKLTAIQSKILETKTNRVPPLPSSLPASFKAEWQALVRHMQSLDSWVPQKAGLVESYLINLQAVRDAQAIMQADGGILAGGRPHPASPIIVRHTATLNKLAEQLGLGKGKLTANPTSKTAPKASLLWLVILLRISLRKKN